MLLDDDQVKTLLAWLKKHWRQETERCPICKANDWAISRQIMELRQFGYGGFDTDPVNLSPLVQVNCKICHHTILFNALEMGLGMEPEELEREAREAEEKK